MEFITNQHLNNSADIRREARAQLQGRWKQAILLCLVPAILSFILVGGGVVSFLTLLESGPTAYLAADDGNGFDVIINFVSGFITVGITYTFLDMIRYPHYAISPLRDAFQVFSKKYFVSVFLIQIIQGFFIFLWTLLLIIPGIIASYSYSQAYFIYKDLRDEPNEEFPSSLDCIRESKELMRGSKWDRFCLDFSFIGWYLLVAFTFGIAAIWVTPYVETAKAVFYENITNGHFREEAGAEKPYSQEQVAEQAGLDPDDFSDFDDDDFSDY